MLIAPQSMINIPAIFLDIKEIFYQVAYPSK
jgi:hypothetical protein